MQFGFETQLFGLTPAQRASGATAISSFLNNEQVAEVSNRDVEQDKNLHGETALFSQANFSIGTTGDRVFTAALGWASTRSEDAVDGRHSYIRMTAVNVDTRIITTRYAESPGWVDTTTQTSMDTAPHA